jgi:hypothetical protein
MSWSRFLARNGRFDYYGGHCSLISPEFKEYNALYYATASNPASGGYTK